MFRIDLHVHTRRYSPCAASTAIEMMRAAVLAGVDGIAITEHGREYDREILREEQAGAGLDDLTVLVGAELACYPNGDYVGEFLVFGCQAPIEYPERLYPEELIERVHDVGGIIIPPHPFRYSLEIGRAQSALPVDAVEVLNCNCDDEQNFLAHAAAVRVGLPEVGGSDAHSVDRVGLYVTEFERPVQTEEELVREVKEGRCRAQSLAGNLVWSEPALFRGGCDK